MGDSFSKKEQKNRKAKAKQEKAEKKLERKNNNNKGKGLEEMLAYVDENGNLSSVPPQGGAPEIPLDQIRIDAKPRPEDVSEPAVNTGSISYFNSSKGFGFITEDRSKERVFFHINQLAQPVKEGDKVTFLKERTARGYNAVDVKRN
ncbi:cold-shock protein [uncultured Chitinophaga sp.]|jgi:Cold shock proteins|uniref:cold-shock protein n=1 Tax=uncultured Chitinophaga sp. TaxID=339340 RepID=UPI002622C23E|nr:cold shock domain-containing protein [uncultured Chitinophaga sp.]